MSVATLPTRKDEAYRYADLSALAGTGEDRIVQKPFREGELERKVAYCLAESRTSLEPRNGADVAVPT